MPSMTGGDSTDRGYAPHMWILPEGGDPSTEDDYIYVGNLGSVSVDDGGTRYHIGANIVGDLVCETTRLSGDYRVPDTFLGGCAIQDIPEPVLSSALDYALDINAAMPDRRQLVVSLLGTIPGYATLEIDFPGAPGIAEMFDTESDWETTRQRLEELNIYIKTLRVWLGFESSI